MAKHVIPAEDCDCLPVCPPKRKRRKQQHSSDRPSRSRQYQASHQVIVHDLIVPPNSVVPGLTRNPFRVSFQFCNIGGAGGATALIRVHQTMTDPTIPLGQPTGILAVLPSVDTVDGSWPSGGWACCNKAIIQSDICIVNTDQSQQLFISVVEVIDSSGRNEP